MYNGNSINNALFNMYLDQMFLNSFPPMNVSVIPKEQKDLRDYLVSLLEIKKSV